MLSILVSHSYFLRLDQKQRARAKPYPPLATLQVTSLLRQAGHRVTFFDSMLADELDEYDRLLADERPSLVLFYEDNFNFLSKMCLATMRRAACDMILAARRAGARVIVAGPDVTDAPQPYLQAGADVALIGEGVVALLELLSRMDCSQDGFTEDLLRGIPGIASLRDGRVHKSVGSHYAPLAPRVQATAWDLVDMDRYRRVWLDAHGYFSLNMAASRGCSFRCTWCSKPTWGNQYLQRSADEVASEMGFIKRAFAPDRVWFADDIFGFRVDWVRQFAAAATAADAKIPFTIQTRADLISERMARALAEAGCTEAWIGAESGSQRMLDAMNKGTTVPEIIEARDLLKAAGIRVGFFIQLGYLGEQFEDLLATRDLLNRAKPDDIGVSVAYPLPGTRFYDLVKTQMNGKTHWQDSDDLAMMFQGTYTSEFYRAVRDLLHEEILLRVPQSERDREQPAAALAIDERWLQLTSDERRYRSVSLLSAAGA